MDPRFMSEDPPSLAHSYCADIDHDVDASSFSHPQASASPSPSPKLPHACQRCGKAFANLFGLGRHNGWCPRTPANGKEAPAAASTSAGRGKKNSKRKRKRAPRSAPEGIDSEPADGAASSPRASSEHAVVEEESEEEREDEFDLPAVGAESAGGFDAGRAHRRRLPQEQCRESGAAAIPIEITSVEPVVLLEEEDGSSEEDPEPRGAKGRRAEGGPAPHDQADAPQPERRYPSGDAPFFLPYRFFKLGGAKGLGRAVVPWGNYELETPPADEQATARNWDRVVIACYGPEKARHTTNFDISTYEAEVFYRRLFLEQPPPPFGFHGSRAMDKDVLVLGFLREAGALETGASAGGGGRPQVKNERGPTTP
eukprot:tig00000190_g13850.t1